MNYSTFILFLLLFLYSCNNQNQNIPKNEQTTKSGLEVQSPSGHFTVALPPDFPAPEADTQHIVSEGDSITMFTYISETKRGICFFGSNEYSSRTFARQSANDMLDNAQNAALKQWNGQLIDRKLFEKNGAKGMSYWFNTTMDGKDFYGRFDCLLSRPRMYQVGFLSFDKSELYNPDIQHYFSSMSIPLTQVQ